jgi:hypothetical protein
VAIASAASRERMMTTELEAGASMVEYAFIVGAIALVVIISALALGKSTSVTGFEPARDCATSLDEC